VTGAASATLLEILAIAISVALVLVAWAQFLVVRAQRHHDELLVQSALLAAWKRLEPDWHRCIGAVAGPDDYYSPVYGDLRAELQEQATNRSELTGRLRGDTEVKNELAVRAVLTFLGFVAAQVLRGRVSPAFVWSLLGTDVIRRARPLRQVMEFPAEDKTGPALMLGGATWFYPGLGNRVRSLIDILWAEGARLGELADAEAIRVANHKRAKNTSQFSRDRVRRLGKSYGG
jgi:hypothetical protein